MVRLSASRRGAGMPHSFCRPSGKDYSPAHAWIARRHLGKEARQRPQPAVFGPQQSGPSTPEGGQVGGHPWVHPGQMPKRGPHAGHDCLQQTGLLANLYTQAEEDQRAGGKLCVSPACTENLLCTRGLQSPEELS